MNSGVIVKIEYKPNTGDEYQELDMIPHSGSFTEPMKDSAAGFVYSFTSNFKIAEVDPETDSALNNMTGRRGTFRITDANNRVYTVGDLQFRSNFTYTRRVDGAPGSFNGYDCTITRQSPSPCPVV